MAVTVATFAGKYTLTSLNSEASPEPVKLELSAVEGKTDAIDVYAAVANRMRGQVAFSDAKPDGSATVKGMLMSTMMMGPPFMMKVEQALAQALSNGCRIHIEGTTLTIHHGKDKLVFARN